MKLRSRNKSLSRVVPIYLGGAKAAPALFVLLALLIFAFSAINPGPLSIVRTRTVDLFSPLLAAVNKPVYQAAEYARAVSGLAELQEENMRLRQENARLRDWYQTALSLQSENQDLQNLLNVKLAPQNSYITARVIADTGNAFAKSLLVLAGQQDGVVTGQAVLAGDGLLGRVIESGNKTSRVLLLSDINSRIPVLVQGTNQRAVMAGNNDDMPTLLHLPEDIVLEEGVRVITSGHGGMFPYGLPVGTLSKNQDGTYIVKPYSNIERVHIVRIVDKSEDPNLKQGLRP